jgi:nicotinamidase-related amidase
VRDPPGDHLLTPQNAALLLIDSQPTAGRGPLDGSRPPGRERRLDDQGHQDLRGPGRALDHQRHYRPGAATLSKLAGLLTEDKPLDRTTTNSWEDIEFVQAVRATGRRKLIRCALWTEICMAFTALDALREGYDVCPVVDAIGGTSPEAHRAGLDRVRQAGGQPVSRVSRTVELQRDWARDDSVQAIIEIVLTDRLLKEQ